MSRAFAFLLGLAAVGLTGGAEAMSLAEAIGLAQRTNPTLAESRARADAARARLQQADAGRLPTLTLTGQAGAGTADLGGFFGFGRSEVYPRQAALQLRQPLYAGGGVNASIEAARAMRDAAMLQVAGAKALLSAQTAEAYIGVLDAREVVRVNDAELRQLDEIARQSKLRFEAGEIPRTDLAEAEARQARARAEQAAAQGETVRAESRFQSVVGQPPASLEPVGPPPPTPESLDDAIARAADGSPALLAARASERAAASGVRAAQAARLPSVSLVAQASTTRDQFFPGYRNDGVTVGIEGHWTLFDGGATSGRVAEARAAARAAQDAYDAARAQVRDAVVDAWEDVQVARSVAEAAAEQLAAADSALESVREEVRVGQKPTLDLLNAEQEATAARTALVSAKGSMVASAYRLVALLGGD